MVPLGYVAFLVAALIVTLLFIEGVWLGVALTILALAASIVPEMVVDLRYSRYREEWQAANRPANAQASTGRLRRSVND